MPVLMVMAITVRGITDTLLITAIASATGRTITIIPTLITITDINLITAIGPRVPLGKEVPGEAATGAARVFRTGAEGLAVEGQAVLRQEASHQEASHQEVGGRRAVGDGQALAAVGGGVKIGRNSLL
jgi:hypothetical protein